MLTIINQIFEISKKTEDFSYDKIQRNLTRLDNEFIENGYKIINPLGRTYKDTDTDVDANLLGELSDRSVITKVMKPIVYLQEGGEFRLIQKGIVIVE